MTNELIRLVEATQFRDEAFPEFRPGDTLQFAFLGVLLDYGAEGAFGFGEDRRALALMF